MLSSCFMLTDRGMFGVVAVHLSVETDHIVCAIHSCCRAKAVTYLYSKSVSAEGSVGIG